MNHHPYFKMAFAAVASLVFFGVAADPQESISEQDLQMFFESIVPSGTNFVFTFNRTGNRFVYSIDKQEPKVCEYGEKVSLSSHSEFKVFDRHHFLSFSLLPEKLGMAGFRLSLKKDFRSMSGEVASNAVYLVEAPKERTSLGKSTTSGKRCLFGMKIIPCSEEMGGK